MLSFRQHNLLSPWTEAPFDLAMLKNVLIYFDAASKKCAFANVLAGLRPDGILILGATEGANELARGLLRREPGIFQKPRETT